MRKILLLALSFLLLLDAKAQGATLRDDLAARLAPDSVATLTISGIDRTVDLESGAILLRLDDPGCTPSPGHGCTGALNYLRLSLIDFSVDLTVGGDATTVTLGDPMVIGRGPVSIEDVGDGFVIPSGTGFFNSANMFGVVSGEDLAGRFASTAVQIPAPAVVRVTLLPDQSLTIDGTFDFSFSVNGTTIPGSISLFGSAEVPFFNTPPLAFAGVDRTVDCTEDVVLDGSGSTDADGADDIVSYRWLREDDSLLAEGKTATVDLPLGPSTITLEVKDAFGAISRDTVVITVADVPPVFTFVPPDIATDVCAGLDIGKALAESPCGSTVTVTSDAPSSFTVGVTVVTWTATTSTGLTATATQTVTVSLGDDPACCPAGTNVIVGTEQRDNLSGTEGADCILGLGGGDRIDGMDGNDLISGGAGDDVIHAGAGNDVITAGDGDDHVMGEDGDDDLHGGAGRDKLICGAGDDSASGDAGDDLLNGNDGNDALNGGADRDICNGNGGQDTFLACDVHGSN